jgi:choline kinase/phosphohistidine swiveling domain-containing protein
MYMTSPLIVILGAGEPHFGREPSAIQKTSGNRRTLDWIIESFNSVFSDPQLRFVGGYRFEDVIRKYPDIHFTRNEDWRSTDAVGSLLSAPLSDGSPLYVVYADTIFEATTLQKLEAQDADVTVAVDSAWDDRYQERDLESLNRAEKICLEGSDTIKAIGSDLTLERSDAEFTGLTRLSPEALATTKELVAAEKITETDDLPALIAQLSDRLKTAIVDIKGSWAELEEPGDISRFVLDTKANTLQRLSSIVDRSTILDQYTFTVEAWKRDKADICTDIAAEFNGADVIVRSSSLDEDTWNNSNAGRFESVLDIPSDDRESLETAIQCVIDSYPSENGRNQVLVQPMVANVSQSGVVMTRSLSTHSPYYVVNYDPATTSTESVTDGTGSKLRTAFFRKDIVNNDAHSLNRVQALNDLDTEPLLTAIQEVEDVVNHDALDIEFAIDQDGEVYLLQVRPIVTDPGDESPDDEAIFTAIENAKRDFEASQPPSPSILGSRTIYGVMPDWNPAEIIGRRPGLLAESTYRYLIMDEIWAQQRAEFGYRDVRPQPLMTCFAGQPYVDVRAVFNSFIPASVSEELAEKLVEYYLDRLESKPELHDKVEFEIAVTCLPFDFEYRAEPLIEAGFSETELAELRQALREITLGAVKRVEGGRDLEQVERLEGRFKELQDADLSPLRSAHYLLEDCRRIGTLPFAHLARAAFVATSLLRSLERIGILSDEDVSRFRNSITTVARQFERDGYRVSEGELSWEEYIDSYGHLRPGTYDITSPAYVKEPENYLRPMVETATDYETYPDPSDVWDTETKAEIEVELDALGLEPDIDRFISFLTESIAGREYAKFVFSKNLSLALEKLAAYGDSHGLSREQLSRITLDDYFELLANHPPKDPAEWLSERARRGRERSLVTEAVELPPLLFDLSDFDYFERPTREPNFVTSEIVRAGLVEITAEEANVSLDGSIVMIPQADPGYDWIFGHDIAGLITIYGGANSHMAVRAAEFGIPAAIGVGEDLFQQLSGAELVEIDCAGQTIERLK